MGSADFSGVIEPQLLEWAAQVMGADVEGCERISGGASRLSYSLRFVPGGRAARAFLRVDSGKGPLSGTEFTLQREVAVMQSLCDSQVRLPQIYASSDQHSAVLMECVAGSSDFLAVDEPARAMALQQDLLAQLALLHRASPDLGSVFGEDTPATVRDALRREVGIWAQLLRHHVPAPDPALGFALDWLARAAPGGDEPPVLVHGDIGPGNFMFDGNTVSALIDWEIAHAGHPLEDLACIIARTLGVPFGDLRAHVALYGELSGRPVDYRQLDYCLVLVLTRFSIGISMGIARPSVAVDVPMLLRFLQVNLHALLRTLARLAAHPSGETSQVPQIDAHDTPDHALYEYAGAVLSDQLAPALDEPFLKARAGGLSGMLDYLGKRAAYGTDRLHNDELAALRRVMGPQVATIHEARYRFGSVLKDASETERSSILAWLQERSAREHELMRGMLGPMYARSLQY